MIELNVIGLLIALQEWLDRFLPCRRRDQHSRSRYK
jgi:hypothetical protein